MLVGGNLPEATESFVIQNVKAHSTVHSISFEQKYEDNTVTRWEFKGEASGTTLEGTCTDAEHQSSGVFTAHRTKPASLPEAVPPASSPHIGSPVKEGSIQERYDRVVAAIDSFAVAFQATENLTTVPQLRFDRVCDSAGAAQTTWTAEV